MVDFLVYYAGIISREGLELLYTSEKITGHFGRHFAIFARHRRKWALKCASLIYYHFLQEHYMELGVIKTSKHETVNYTIIPQKTDTLIVCN